uniref:DipZ protein n=1 Tax=uncultured Microgenomates bacterium Rifle_16ft_4_minimus_38077 TaxID=1665117 RepID=A0A0H4T6P4_9BACT|nr:DipZ protein [uncultured Microgenomates bacterium Rifle_16ft_4_minimus_38077]
MLILIAFSFLAGIVTILSPCILPIAPIILSSSLGGGRRRPLGVVTGFILSFSVFTLFLTSLVRAVGISPEVLRSISIIIIFVFGASLLIPKFQIHLERLFTKLASLTPNVSEKSGFSGGLLIGVSVGLLWTPCVGPILGSVISLALTGTVTKVALLITLSYSVGTAIPMLAIVYGGRSLLNRVPWLLRNTAKIQKIFGIIMILTAIAIYFNIDRNFQAYILDKFPNYGVGLTKLEDNKQVKDQIGRLEEEEELRKEDMGKPMFELIEDMGRAPEIIPGGQWFNTSASSVQDLPELAEKRMALESLRGKVVLIDFWTYTCINCIRTIPYLNSWHEKYSDNGLVIIGVHTPEFEFEKSAKNVAQAIADFEIKYPVVQDNNYATWRAYDNRYWPAKYLINKDGRISYTHFGEGAYDKTEEIIQSLLAEAGNEINEEIDNPTYSIFSRTPELYLGYSRMQYFATPYQLIPDKKYIYSSPEMIARNNFAFTGEWEVGSEYSMPSAGATLSVEFEAKDVFLVMRPKIGEIGRLKVYLDGKSIENQDAKGEDVETDEVVVDSDRLYKLIHLESPGQHNLRLEFQDSNLEVYAFTFG